MERVEYGTDGNPYKLFISTGVENTEQHPTVKAIPKADIQEALKEGSKDISENVLAIVREEYISKADYENRLKADMVAVLDKLRAEIKQEIIPRNSDQYDHEAMWQNMGLRMALKVIDKYKAESESEE